jgi:ribosomal protein S18 acetylase RimI-like enzyme
MEKKVKTVQVRRLGPADAAAYRTLMLQAYELHPDAFTSTVDERASLPLTWWEARVKEGADALEMVLGAFQGPRLAGAVGLSFETREKARHKAHLFGMYVPATFRKGGIGRQLVMSALEHARARKGVSLVQLTVTQGNGTAQGLYERCGFVPFGVEPFAISLAGDFVSKVHMWCDLGVRR